MKDTTGLLVGLAFNHAAASSSACPPISPMRIIPRIQKKVDNKEKL
jgi:hypothetical protein